MAELHYQEASLLQLPDYLAWQSELSLSKSLVDSYRKNLKYSVPCERNSDVECLV